MTKTDNPPRLRTMAPLCDADRYQFFKVLPVGDLIVAELLAIFYLVFLGLYLCAGRVRNNVFEAHGFCPGSVERPENAGKIPP